MSANAAQPSLEAVLEQELQYTELLLQTLSAERTALASRDLAALESTTNDKIELYQKLESLDAQRQNIVAELGFQPGRAEFTRCFESLPEAMKLAKLWLQIMTNIEACKTSNLINGGVLESGRQQVEQALGILRGQGGAPGLYTPAGVTSANLGHRKLGEV
jgi:flagella synthesis protein FlgN